MAIVASPGTFIKPLHPPLEDNEKYKNNTSAIEMPYRV